MIRCPECDQDAGISRGPNHGRPDTQGVLKRPHAGFTKRPNDQAPRHRFLTTTILESTVTIAPLRGSDRINDV